MKKCILLIVALIFCVCKMYGQTNTDSISILLKLKGFENIRCKQDKRILYISFENNKFRWNAKAIAQVAADVKQLALNTDSVIIFPLSNNTTFTELNFAMANGKHSSYKAITATSKSVKQHFLNIFQDLHGENSSLRKLDLVIYPHLRTQFGNYDNPVETQIGLAPMLSTSLWKGMSLNLQVLLMFHNDMQGSTDRKIYPGLVAVNQLLLLPEDIYLNISAGLFPVTRYGMNRHIYGTEMQFRKTFLNGNLCVGVNGSLSGWASFESGQLEYWDMDVFTGNVNVAYRNKTYDLWFKASAGRFVFGDNGVRFDISREFKEVQVGFFVVASDIGHSGGFNFKIPIVPRRYSNPSLFRIRPANTFDWEFRVNTVHPSVVQCKSGNDIDNLLLNNNPDHLTKQVENQIKNDGK